MPSPNYRDPYYRERHREPITADGKTLDQESSDSTRMMGTIFIIVGILFIIAIAAFILVA